MRSRTRWASCRGWSRTATSLGRAALPEVDRAAGSDNAETVAAKMREMPVRDDHPDRFCPRADGRMITDMYLVKVKSPGESKGRWDFFNILSTIPAEQTRGAAGQIDMSVHQMSAAQATQAEPRWY